MEHAPLEILRNLNAEKACEKLELLCELAAEAASIARLSGWRVDGVYKVIAEVKGEVG